MLLINAENLTSAALNQQVRDYHGDCEISACLGQRFIGAGASQKNISITGIPGNALGAYLDGANIVVHGNAQDAVGDTMNDGDIIIHGNIGDAAGYAMRGGAIYVKGNAGYRGGIHMKAYQDKIPALVIGGRTGSFLGEYQAGGLILVLGLHQDGKPIVSNFPCTGMHGGKMFLRGTCENIRFPQQVTTHRATKEDLAEIKPLLRSYCAYFGAREEELRSSPFTVVTPDSNNPYRQMYVTN